MKEEGRAGVQKRKADLDAGFASVLHRGVPTSSDRVIDGRTDTDAVSSSTPSRFDRWRFWTAAILTHGKGRVHHLPEAWLILTCGACMLTEVCLWVNRSLSSSRIAPDRLLSGRFDKPLVLPATCHPNEARHAQSSPPYISEAICRSVCDRGDRHALRLAGQGLAGQGFERRQVSGRDQRGDGQRGLWPRRRRGVHEDPQCRDRGAG